MHNTMADIDNALTEFQGESREGSRTHDGFADSRASFTSERTADLTAEDEHSEADGGDDYASRSAAARAALAVNAQRQIESAQQREKIEEERRKAEALRQFEEEEARQRELLLEKERERQAKVAAGEIDLKKDDKPKVAPIAGIDMSDESDSEGSLDDLHDFNDKTHSPLFGNLASTPKEGTAPKENGSSLKKSIEPEPKPEPETEPEPVVSIPAAPQATVPTAETQDEKEQSEASQANGSSQAGSTLGAAAATAIAAGAGTAVVTSRSISPTPLPSRREANPSDQHSVDESSRGRVSLTDDSTAGGTGTGPGTAATSLAAAGTETPKSTAGIAPVQSPPPSAAASASQPTGDPAEWTVDQVVDWARSKGWDEASVVSKFKEHEISGDVLLEMDINILKEIEIVAFGKRFQVANAIKELKKPASGALLESPAMLTSPRSEGTSSPAPPPAAALYTPPTEGALATPAARSVSGADIPSPGPRPGDSSFDQRASGSVRSRPDSYINESAPVTGGQAFSGPGGVAAWQAHQAGQAGRPYSNQGSDAYGRHEAFGNDEPQGLLAERQFGAANRRSTVSNEDVLGALPSSPRKRESAGSGSLSKSADRTSFFGIGQRNRKPPPKVSAYGGSSQDDERPSKGTFSRLGFARSSKALSSYSDMKNNISLPTSSPSYDANGDTARRNRMSTQSGGTIGAGGNQHARQTSVGSAGPGATPNDWNASAAGVGQGVSGPQSADGPVMSRIRPVDLEGWMRKKGERYNSWKPRYLALKGSDLVILRDPQAEKIKGYVSMKGYKVIADENTNPGKYGFMILHETEKPHYLSSEDPVLVREWMKGLMKSTIGRDHSCEYAAERALIVFSPSDNTCSAYSPRHLFIQQRDHVAQGGSANEPSPAPAITLKPGADTAGQSPSKPRAAHGQRCRDPDEPRRSEPKHDEWKWTVRIPLWGFSFTFFLLSFFSSFYSTLSAGSFDWSPVSLALELKVILSPILA